MNNFYKIICLSFMLMVGCGSQQLKDLDTVDPIEKQDREHKPETIAAQRIMLPSLTDLLARKTKKLDPVITQDFLLCFEDSAIVFLDIKTHEVYKKIEGLSVQAQPIFKKDTLLLVTSEHGLVTLSWPEGEILQTKKIEAPLLATPIVLQNGDIFMQYIHNIAELLTEDFDVRWRISLPSFSQYYQSSSYKACTDQEAMYLSFPGNGIMALDIKTGLMRWNYRGFVEISALSHPTLGEKQVSYPLMLVENQLVAKISDGSIHLIDKETGIGLDLLAATPESPLFATSEQLYYVDQAGALICYNVADREQVWRNSIFETMPLLSMKSFDANRLVINAQLPHLYVVDAQDGVLLEHFVHQFYQARLLSDQDGDTIYGIDKFGVFFKLFPEKFA